jgi:chemotaxis protein MotB
MPLRKFKNKSDHEHFVPKTQKWERHPAPSNHDESNWLVSYADMMTLLCGFFIMMFSLSHIDQPKYEAAKKEIAKEFGGKYEKPKTDELAKFVTQALNEAQLGNQATIETDSTGVAVTFQSTVFFDTLSADVKPEGKIVLDKLIGTIATRQAADKKEYRIVVEGHTDSRPILGGNYPSNWELSGARASRVVRMFLDRSFSPQMLTAIGYAETRPKVPSRTPAGEWDEEALSKNRRVVLRILDPDTTSVPLAQAAAPAAPAAPAIPAVTQPATTAH